MIFDDGRRMMWATTFENDWDPYFEDFVQIGIEHFLDWMQHTTQYTHVAKWLEESGGAEKFRLDNPDLAAQMKRSVAGLKAIVQSVQSPATGYFNNLRAWTMPEIVKGQAREGGVPAGARRPRRRGGAAAPGAEAAARAGRRLNPPAPQGRRRRPCGPWRTAARPTR